MRKKVTPYLILNCNAEVCCGFNKGSHGRDCIVVDNSLIRDLLFLRETVLVDNLHLLSNRALSGFSGTLEESAWHLQLEVSLPKSRSFISFSKRFFSSRNSL